MGHSINNTVDGTKKTYSKKTKMKPIESDRKLKKANSRATVNIAKKEELRKKHRKIKCFDTETETIDTDETNRDVQFFCDEQKKTEVEQRPTSISPEKGSYRDDIVQKGINSLDCGSEALEEPAEPAIHSYMASTFIPINDAYSEVTNTVANIRISYNEEDLFNPNSNLPFQWCKKPLNNSKDTTILLQRMFQEECEGHKLSTHLINTVKTAEQTANAMRMGKVSCFSSCGHKFNTIFWEPTKEAADIPEKKLIKIFLKDLHFTKHPLLLKEHTIATKLEQLYSKYAKRQQDRVCEKLEAELIVERNIVNKLLGKMSENATKIGESVGKHPKSDKLAKHFMAIKCLRSNLHREEAENKEMLSDVLDLWMRLKRQRLTQGFQCTRHRLQIKVDDSCDLVSRSHKWSERYKIELNEVYRENLEEYYRSKRASKIGVVNRDSSTKHPMKPDIVKLANVVKKQLTELQYLPTEPNFDIHLSQIGYDEFHKIVPRTKQHRSYFLKIYFDNEIVAKTCLKSIEADLCVNFDEVIGVFLERRIPRHINIAIFESSKLMKGTNIANMSVMPQTFWDGHIQAVRFDPNSAPALPQQYDGYLNVKFQIDRDLDTSNTSNLNEPMKPEVAIKQNKYTRNKRDASETEAADELPLEAHLDPDSLNHCTFEEDKFEFCTLQSIAKNPRFRLIKSRCQHGNTLTKAVKFIPAFENELIEGDISRNELSENAVGNWMEKIDVYKHDGKKYIMLLYESIKLQCKSVNKTLQYSDHELFDYSVSIWSLLFEPLRRICPVFNYSKDLPPKTHTTSQTSYNQFDIVLNIVRASGIPVREQFGPGNRKNQIINEDNENSPRLNYSNIKPFVGFGYHDKFVRSAVAEGSNPTWNEQLTITLQANIKDLHHDLRISIYDEVIENSMDEYMSMQNSDIHQRVQINWLGEYRIPISSLLRSKKIGGVFELPLPKILIGYKKDTISSTVNPNDSSILIDAEIKECMHLWFYLSIKPICELPKIDNSCLECSELREVRSQLHEWSAQVKHLRPERFIEPLVCTSEGKRVCLTRLLGAIPLPVNDSTNLLQSACRFVALLGILPQLSECMDFNGVWLNNQVILKSTTGSPKDLGVLLCNYMLSIGIQCCLILGIVNPYGESCFVIYRGDDEQHYFIDPHTGQHYSVRDTFCPLLKIYYVVTTDNIYCNMQRVENVSLLNYNLKDTACWLPAFSKKNGAPLGGVQKMNYSYLQSFNVDDLKRNIERKIMKKISSWRTMRKTIWNRVFHSYMMHVLEDLEDFVTFGTGRRSSKSNQELPVEFSNYHIYGFTLNFPYTTLSSVSERIKSTGIHMNGHKNVEFALAVHITVYPNNVLSVWIFIMSVVPIS